MKHLFIVNPVAGGRDKTEYIKKSVSQILGSSDNFEVYTTRAPLDASEKVRAEAKVCDELRVYSVGGDGTLNECVNGAIGHSNVAVSVCPVGTGNDFVRTFGEESEMFLDIKSLIYGEIRPIDLIKCNEKYSINICSAGLDARIGKDVHEFSRYPIIGGKMAYTTSVVSNTIKGTSTEMRVTFGDDGELKRDGKITLICACNGSFYGGGYNPVPEARPDDGALDFLVIGDVSRLKLAKLIGKFKAGRYKEIDENLVDYYKGSSIKIEAEKPICLSLDGEILYVKTAEFKIVPKGINFVFPVGMKYFDFEN